MILNVQAKKENAQKLQMKIKLECNNMFEDNLNLQNNFDNRY